MPETEETPEQQTTLAQITVTASAVVGQGTANEGEQS